MTLAAALGLARTRHVALCGGGGKTSLMFALAREWSEAGERVLVTTTTRIAVAQAEGQCALVGIHAHEVLAQARPLVQRLIVATAGVDQDPRKLRGLASGEVDALARDGFFARVLVEADGSKHRPLKAPAAHEPVFPAGSEAVLMVAGLSGIGHPLSEETVFRCAIWSRLTGLAPGQPVTPRSLAEVVVHEEGLVRGAPPTARLVLFLNQADDPSRIAQGREVCACIAALEGRRPERIVIGRLQPRPEVLHVA